MRDLPGPGIKPVSFALLGKFLTRDPKRNQPLIITERTDGWAEAPILWLPDAKSRLIGKDSDAGED